MKKTESTDKKSTKRSLEEKSVKFFPSSFILKLTHEIETYKESLQQFFLSPSIAKCSMDVLNLTLPHVITSANELAMGGSSDVQDVLAKLHTCDKKVDHVDNIMTSNVICQENAIDNVKLVLSGDQSQFIKQLLTNEAITRSAATCMYSMHHQHLAISQDKGKIMLLQLSSLLKQVEGNRRKLAISRVSSVLAPFTIMSLCGNPCNEEFLAVCGIKECQVMSINSSGHVTDRINLHPSVDSTNGYIVKAIWLPGSQTELAIITDTFVKIYDLSVDSLSPVYYFIVCSDKIRDATFVITEESKNVLVMMSTGHIFCQPIIPECNASDGPIYFTVEFSLSHSSIEEHNSQVCDGGASIYYSHSLHMLFFSYQNGKSFMATLDDTTCKAHQITELVLKNNTTTTNDKTTPAPLINWKDVPNHPGLILALTGITHNPVILLVKPETVQIQELKALPAKSKIQGAVMIRQQPGTGDSYAASRTALVTISEDGSLRVHYCNENVNTAYWFKHQFQPATPLAYLTQPIKKPAKTKKKHSPPKFPVDFFEHCTRMQNSELEFGGSDVLHVYNKEQVKQRLNVGGLYIANTKPGGFTIDVTNLQSDTTVMVGVRVLLGCRSLERTPSYIEVFGRKQEVTFPGGIARWFDVPFSREESLQADKKCQIICKKMFILLLLLLLLYSWS
jgi:E3 ubiquitin-protein ligase UBR4